MKVSRFIAPTARDCLRKVKDELGSDAIVVSNKPVTGGVEIMAMSADSFEALSHQVRRGAAQRDRTAAEIIVGVQRYLAGVRGGREGGQQQGGGGQAGEEFFHDG